jgi:ATP-binding protein involved in chromosome partitioning
MSFRTYHEVAGPDRSALAGQVDAQRARVRERMRGVDRVVAVVSGKGGVGKSWITAALARRFARLGAVGVLDADLESPTVARLLGARGPLRADERAVHPAIARDGIAVVSTDLLLDEGAPLRWAGPEADRFVWRGALEAGALREMLGDVAWGRLSLLLADLPPDAGRLEDLAELVPTLAGAIVVTIPSEESRRSVERAMHRAERLGVRLLGVVENMSGYGCAACGDVGPLFEGDAGAWLASRFGVPLLARVPFIPGAAMEAGAAPLDRLALSLQEVLA